MDKEFIEANKIFIATLKAYRVAGEDKATSYPVITGADLQKLRKFNAFNTNKADELQQKVWWDLHFNFARRGRENDRHMTKETFKINTDSFGKEYIELTHNEFTKNHRGDDSDEIHPRCYANDSPMCPVTSFTKYISKLNVKNDCLWQRPKRKYTESTPEWYANVAVGVNTLGDMMKQISKRLELSKIFTNHSVRATAITVLSNAGIEARHIAKVSGHRSLQSIDNYARDASEEQKQQFSAILQDVPISSSETSTDTSANKSMCSSTTSISNSSTTSVPSCLWLQNCVVNGNISIVNNHNHK